MLKHGSSQVTEPILCCRYFSLIIFLASITIYQSSLLFKLGLAASPLVCMVLQCSHYAEFVTQK